MITEDYVSFETAKLLKEKGFDGVCGRVYKSNGCLWENAQIDGVYLKKEHLFPSEYLAPTIQMATKWLRIVKKLDITIHYDSWACGGHSGYYIVVQRTDNDFSEVSPCVDDEDTVFFDTPESAFDAAIKYCLSALID